MSEKAKYWSGILYPENMVDNWEEEISHILQLPFCYCIHNKCATTKKEVRKVHIHLILAFSNTTTHKHALSIFNKLSKIDSVCCPTCESVNNIRYMYDYLIHNTADCKKKGKHLYKPEDRVSGNGFDIGSYEQIGTVEKLQMCLELADVISKHKFEDYLSFHEFIVRNFDFNYYELLKSNSGYFERLCKGNYLRSKQGGRCFTANYFINDSGEREFMFYTDVSGNRFDINFKLIN